MRVKIFRNKYIKTMYLIATLFILIIISSIYTEFNLKTGILSVPSAILWFFINFTPDIESLDKLPTIFYKIIETVLLSTSATTTASILALFMGLLGSTTTSINSFFSFLSRVIASIFRNIPNAVWAIVLLLSFGQNILTGYFALFFVSFGFLSRFFIETIDELDDEKIRTLQSVGANYMQIIFQCVIPSCIGQLISWVLYMIETNVRSAVLIGMLTGTGIGLTFDIYYKSMQYREAGLVVITITITILLIEFISNFVRRRLY